MYILLTWSFIIGYKLKDAWNKKNPTVKGQLPTASCFLINDCCLHKFCIDWRHILEGKYTCREHWWHFENFFKKTFRTRVLCYLTWISDSLTEAYSRFQLDEEGAVVGLRLICSKFEYIVEWRLYKWSYSLENQVAWHNHNEFFFLTNITYLTSV